MPVGYSGSPVIAGRVQELTAQVIKHSLETLDADGFAKVNYGGTIINSTLAAIAAENNGTVPTGCLGASLMVLKGANIIGPPTPPAVPGTTVPDLTELPRGVLLRDVAGLNAFDGTRTDEVNRPTYYTLPGALLRVTLYETRRRIQPGLPNVGQHDPNPAADFTYAAGDLLYIDLYSGLLTKEVPEDSGNLTPINNPNGTGPSVSFDASDVRNGVWPWEVCQLTDLNVEGTDDLIVRLLI